MSKRNSFVPFKGVEGEQEEWRNLQDEEMLEKHAISRSSHGSALAFHLFGSHPLLYKDQASSATANYLAAWYDLLAAEDMAFYMDRVDHDQRPTDKMLADWLAHSGNMTGVVDWKSAGLEQSAEAELNRYEGEFRAAVRHYFQEFARVRSAERWRILLLQLLALARCGDLNLVADREWVTDAVVQAVRRIASLPSGNIGNFLMFMDGAHALLWFDGRPWTLSRHDSLMNMASAVSGLERHRQAQEFAVCLQERAVAKLLDKEFADIDAMELWQRARRICNSISARLGILGGFTEGINTGLNEGYLVLAKLMNRMQVINALGSALPLLWQEQSPEDRILSDLWQAFGIEWSAVQDDNFSFASRSQSIAALGAMVRAMANVIDGWAQLDEGIFEYEMRCTGSWPERGCLDQHAGLLILSLTAALRWGGEQTDAKTIDSTVSALCNAGIAVNRIRRDSSSQRADVCNASAAVYFAMGLHFASKNWMSSDVLRLDSRSIGCLVNLMSNLSRRFAHGAAVLDPVLAPLMKFAFQCASDEKYGLRKADQEQLRVSLRRWDLRMPAHQLGIDFHVWLVDEFQPALGEIIQRMIRSIDADGHSWSSRNDGPLSVARVLNVLVRCVLNSQDNVSKYAAVSSTLTRLLGTMLRLCKDDPYILLRRLLLNDEPRAARSAEIQDAMEGAAKCETFVYRKLTESVQRQGGELGLIKWREIFDRVSAFQAECPAKLQDYATFLKQDGVLGWLNGVGLNRPQHGISGPARSSQ
jgi:hypothetical protein